jgi:hypothetical protein
MNFSECQEQVIPPQSYHRYKKCHIGGICAFRSASELPLAFKISPTGAENVEPEQLRALEGGFRDTTKSMLGVFALCCSVVKRRLPARANGSWSFPRPRPSCRNQRTTNGVGLPVCVAEITSDPRSNSPTTSRKSPDHAEGLLCSLLFVNVKSYPVGTQVYLKYLVHCCCFFS